MPKKEVELTAKQKALSDAKVKLDTADKAHTAKPTPATDAALKTAESAVNAAFALVKRENFVRVAGSRVKKARIAIRNLGNINSLRNYTYSEADIATAERGITEMMQKAFASMREGLLTKTSAAPASDNFSFTE